MEIWIVGLDFAANECWLKWYFFLHKNEMQGGVVGLNAVTILNVEIKAFK